SDLDSNDVLTLTGFYARGLTQVKLDGTSYAAPGSSTGSLTGDGGANTINGSTGNDVISGLGGNDKLFGGDGNDTIFGGDGVDTIDGGNGNDRIDGGLGGDHLFSGTGADRYVFTSAADSTSTSMDIITDYDFNNLHLDRLDFSQMDADTTQP